MQLGRDSYGMDWGIQVDQGPIAILGTVADWNYAGGKRIFRTWPQRFNAQQNTNTTGTSTQTPSSPPPIDTPQQQQVPAQTYPDGTTVTVLNETRIYIMRGGKRRHIPNPPTLALMGLTGDQAIRLTREQFDSIPEGTPIPDMAHIKEGSIIAVPDGGGIFKIEGGRVRHYPNPTTLVAMGDHEKPRILISQDLLDNLPKGEPFAHLEGSPTAAQKFPLKGSERTELGDHRRMKTDITISNNGRVDGVTRTWTDKQWTGFTGSVAVQITDRDGNVIYVTEPRSYGVQAKRLPGPSDRTQSWSDQIPAGEVSKVGGYRIIHTTSPRNRWRDWLKEAGEAVKAARELKKEFDESK